MLWARLARRKASFMYAMNSSLNSSVSSVPAVDVLAIAAHRDDVEQTCGGTLLKMAQRGLRTGILDLTRGEMGTRGTAEEREAEAAEAARLLQAAWRGALDIPDSRVENTWDNKLKLAAVVRALRPRVVILPYWHARHPDHYTCSVLGYEACFLAGLAKLDLSAVSPDLALATGDWRVATGPHRPFKIIYASLYYDVRPTFVVDITGQFEARLQALLAYKSQYSDQQAGRGLFPLRAEVRTRQETMARFYGMLAGVQYAEPFVQKEIGLVDDVTAVPVASL
jgi:bacillithiol biosynthesis deacetylase BshB1